jgi:diguanylate cyclase (GGDEF)-like protein
MNQLIRGSHEQSDPFLDQTKSEKEGSFLHQQLSARPSSISRTTKPNIVVIDDQLSIAQSLAKTLEDFALNVSYFTSIDDFKKAQDDIDVDLVLLDIVMPDVTEVEVFDFAKTLVSSGVKVISCSSKFTFDSRLLAVRAQVSDYAVKPINTYTLVEKIGRALGLQQNRKYHLVIVDDQKNTGTFYKAMLEQVGCEVTFFDSAKSLFETLDDLTPDMFLLDMMMPGVDGLEVARMIRQEHKFDFSPILFITGDELVETRLAAIDAGADDVISKSTAVNIITHQILTRLARASKVSAFVAKDALTGVLNHSQIVEQVNQTMRTTKRRKSKSTIVVIDVDHFKKVNDNYGHVVGDKVLCALGQLLANSIRETDTVGRYGGEEFVIVFEDCDVDDGANKVQLIKDAFSKMRFGTNDKEFGVTFSAGLINLGSFDNVMPAIAAADKALYKAKSDGRNRVVKYKLSEK